MIQKIRENGHEETYDKTLGLPKPNKAGLFFSKEKKTEQLSAQNQELERQIESMLQIFKQKKCHIKQIESNYKNVINSIEITSLENLMMQKELSQVTLKSEQNQQKIKELKSQLSHYENESMYVQQSLYVSSKKCEEQKNLLERYQEEIKIEKSVRYVPDSIQNICRQLEKQLELEKRNIKIHQDKLQGKQKYLKILQKKRDQENRLKVENRSLSANGVRCGKNKQIISIYQKKVGFKSPETKSKANTVKLSGMGFEKKPNFQKVKQQTKEDIVNQKRHFNDITRKKNAIISRNGAKK